VIFPAAAGASTHAVSLTWRWPSRREQRLAEVFPSLLLGGFRRRLDQGQVLPALLQGLLLCFGIALVARAGGPVYQLEERKTRADKLSPPYRFPAAAPHAKGGWQPPGTGTGTHSPTQGSGQQNQTLWGGHEFVVIFLQI